MKKIIFIFIFSMLFTFTFLNNSHAASGERYTYEKIDLIYDENFNFSYVGRLGYTDILKVTANVQSDIFIDYDYMDNIEENVFLYLDFTDFMKQNGGYSGYSDYGINAFNFYLVDTELIGNTLIFTVYMDVKHFSYYYSEVKGINKSTFMSNFTSYVINGLYEYFKLIVRVDTDEYDGPYEYEKTIDLVYNDNFNVNDINIGDNNVEISFSIVDDTFIDYKFKDNINENVFLQLDYYQHAQNEYASPPNIELYNSEIINENELHATVSIPKTYFNYYIYEIIKTDETTFYDNFEAVLQYDLYQYFKLYVRLDEVEYTYIKFTEYNATDIYLKETGPITSLFDLYIYINTDYKLENDIILTFRQDVDYDLHRGLDLGYNSYEILEFKYSMDYYRWRIHLRIALLNSLLEEYDNDVEYIIENLMEIYVATIVAPSRDYINGYNKGYLDGIAEGEQFGWHDGYNIGYDEGYDEGYFEGVRDSYSQGYDAGYEAGLQASQGEAYDKGYQKGANESFIANIDKWLVPAIIVVMILGGYFAITRQKRDGDI